MNEGIRNRFNKSVEEAQSVLLDPSEIQETLKHLVREGDLTQRQADELFDTVQNQIDGSRYILGNFAVHLAIGAVFAFDVVPLPLGTIARVAWVAGNRIAAFIRRDADRARVHSAGVLLIAAIPWVGYAAYLLPLRRTASELGFLIANQSWLARTGRSYEDFVADQRPLLQPSVRWLVPFPEFTDSVEEDGDRSGTERPVANARE